MIINYEEIIAIIPFILYLLVLIYYLYLYSRFKQDENTNKDKNQLKNEETMQLITDFKYIDIQHQLMKNSLKILIITFILLILEQLFLILFVFEITNNILIILMFNLISSITLIIVILILLIRHKNAIMVLMDNFNKEMVLSSFENASESGKELYKELKKNYKDIF